MPSPRQVHKLPAAAIVIVAVCYPALPTRADDVGREAMRAVAQAKKSWRELDFELVVKAADRALSAGDASAADKIDALWLKGSSLVILGRNPEAVAVFEQLFAIAPDFLPPGGTSPRILAVFNPARARWQVLQEQKLSMKLGPDLAAMKLEASVPRRGTGGRPLTVVAELTDPKNIAHKIVLSYRREGQAHYATITRRAVSGRNRFDIPGAFTESRTAFSFQLYLSVRHRTGVTLRRVGDASHPLTVQIAAGLVPASRPITRQWWFWTGVAVIAAAAVSIPIIVLNSVDVGPQTVVGRRKP